MGAFYKGFHGGVNIYALRKSGFTYYIIFIILYFYYIYFILFILKFIL